MKQFCKEHRMEIITFLIWLLLPLGLLLCGVPLNRADAGVPLKQRIVQHKHSNERDGGRLFLITGMTTVTNTASTLSSNNMNVTLNDVYMVCGRFKVDFSTAPTTFYGLIAKGSGTATLENSTYYYPGGLSSVSALGNACCIIKITGTGTLVLQNMISIGGGTGLSYYNWLQILPLLKQ